MIILEKVWLFDWANEGLFKGRFFFKPNWTDYKNVSVNSCHSSEASKHQDIFWSRPILLVLISLAVIRLHDKNDSSFDNFASAFSRRNEVKTGTDDCLRFQTYASPQPRVSYAWSPVPFLVYGNRKVMKTLYDYWSSLSVSWRRIQYLSGATTFWLNFRADLRASMRNSPRGLFRQNMSEVRTGWMTDVGTKGSVH